MKKEIELLPPMMPNTIFYKQPIRNRQDGAIFNTGISVHDLSEQEAEEYSELMKQTFIDHWKNKVAQKQLSVKPTHSP